VAADPREVQLLLRARLLSEQGLGYALDRPALHAAPRKRGNEAPPPQDPATRAARSPVREAAPESPSPAQPPARGPLPVPPDSPFGGTGSPELQAIRAELGDCRRCRLCEGRTNLVFGVGNPRARVMFIGEGPGADEDAKGEPFVGRAGQLLTDIITKGMGLRRPEEIYIANVVKCRPPENRDPKPDEAASCLPFLRAQIRSIRPEVIVLLGRIPLTFLFDREPTSVKITRERGMWLEIEGIPAMPTFHPSYLLRNPPAKKEVWLDIQEVMKKLGLPPPKKG